jgi:hypothetical protein
VAQMATVTGRPGLYWVDINGGEPGTDRTEFLRDLEACRRGYDYTNASIFARDLIRQRAYLEMMGQHDMPMVEAVERRQAIKQELANIAREMGVIR